MDADWSKGKSYHGYQVNVNKRSETIDLSNYIDNGKWKLIGVKVIVAIVTRSMSKRDRKPLTSLITSTTENER